MSTRNWEEALQFEVMEDYLMHVELRHLAKDPVKHMEESRAHYEKLKTFITTLLSEQREEVREKIRSIHVERPNRTEEQEAYEIKRHFVEETKQVMLTSLQDPIT